MANRKSTRKKTTAKSGAQGGRGTKKKGGQAKATVPPATVARGGHRDDADLRQHLIKLLDGGQAHARFEDAVKDFPAELQSRRPGGVPYSAWELLEHLRIAQWDILEFSRDRNHVSPEWPRGYWPEGGAPPDAGAWDKSIAAIRSDLEALRGLVANPRTDLFARIPHGDGQTILREALLAADHNAYHLGQLVMLRKLLGAWKD